MESSTNTQVESNTRLFGRWLFIARLAWIAMFVALTLMYVFGFFSVHEELSKVCNAEPCTLREQIRHAVGEDKVMSWPGPSIGYADRLRPDQVEALERVGLTLNQYGWLGALQMGLPLLVYLLIAAGLFWQKSDDWMVLFASLMAATIPVGNIPLPFVLVVRQPAWEWVFDAANVVALSCFLTFPLIFPTGRFVLGWTRWMALFEFVGAVTVTFFRDSILEIPGSRYVIGGYVLISLGAGAYAQLYRYYRVASLLERQQLKWVVVGLVGFVSIAFTVLIPLDALLTSRSVDMDPARALLLFVIPDTIFQVILLFIPISIAVSVLRYRLWDIDIFMNRTLVYGALTASAVALYVLIVGWSSIGLQAQNNLGGSVLAILVIGFLFQPLRQGLQHVADRFVPLPQSASGWRVEGHKPHITITESQGADITLRGRRLTVVRVTWIITFIALNMMYVFGFLVVRDVLSTVCGDEPCSLIHQIRHTAAGDQVADWIGPPVGSADPLRADQVKALDALGLTLNQYGWLGALQMGIPILVLLLIAAGLFWRKSDNWMAVFVSMMIATIPLHGMGMPLSFTLAVRQPAWEWIYFPAMAAAISFFFIFPLIFPTGHFVPRWTRWIAMFEVAGAVLVTWFQYSILRVPAGQLVGVYLYISLGAGVYAQLYRYFRAATVIERQQLKWVVVGMVAFIGATAMLLVPLSGLLSAQAASTNLARALLLSTVINILFRIISLFVPVAIVISVLRYRLWDIDILINRTLVYGTLTGIIVIAFVIVVGFLNVLVQSNGNSIVTIVATGLVALLFQPLRQRLQGSINRLMYGDRDDPYAALSRLGRRLESSIAPETLLPTIVTTVRDALKLSYSAIYLKQSDDDYKIIAESASPSLRVENGKIRIPGMEREGRCIPLIHQGETLGYLVLGPRTPNEAFTASDLRLVDDLAPQVGVAVHAIRLTADLQRSREQLVLTREEERRRLRRDLHDDLGPTLASLGLVASTVAVLIPNDPTAATKMVNDLESQIRETVGNVRRLVYELRPPTLDELGLLAAVSERATRYSNAPDGFHVTVEAPVELPVLPAAVEVAAYRIVQEALANVSKHARARQCTICFTYHTGLEIEVTDDGIGLPSSITPGVGLRSMRERAEELGGSCLIERGINGGTRMLARLPIGEFRGGEIHGST